MFLCVLCVKKIGLPCSYRFNDSVIQLFSYFFTSRKELLLAGHSQNKFCLCSRFVRRFSYSKLTTLTILSPTLTKYTP